MISVSFGETSKTQRFSELRTNDKPGPEEPIRDNESSYVQHRERRAFTDTLGLQDNRRTEYGDDSCQLRFRT